MEELENLEPIPITDSEIEFPRLSINKLSSRKAAKYAFLFSLLSLLPLLLSGFCPQRVKVLTASKQQHDSLSERPPNKFSFFVQNLNNFNDFLVASFQVYTGDHKYHNLSMKVSRSVVFNDWHVSQKSSFSKVVSTNSTMPIPFFSEYITNTRIVAIDVEFAPNTTMVSIVNCFVEHSLRASLYYEVFLHAGTAIILGALFFAFTYAIEQTGLLHPQQFATQFYLVPMAACNFPLDIFRFLLNVKLIRVVKSVLDVVSTATIMSIEVWLVMLITKKENKRQIRVTFGVFFVVFVSVIVSLFSSLQQTLFMKQLHIDQYWPFVFQFIALLFICAYSLWVINSTSGEEFHSARIYLGFICIMNIFIVMIMSFSFVERHWSNSYISNGLKSSSRIAFGIFLSFFHWPTEKSKKKAKKERIKRNQYTKYIGESSKERLIEPSLM